MTFAPLFQGLRACAFMERAFQVDQATFQALATVYPLPDTLSHAVLKRQVEFVAGRACARQALARLTGETQAVIPTQDDRAPQWPAGFVGSITHTTGYAAALVAPSAAYYGLGIDCEHLLSPEQLALQRHICTAQELETLQASQSGWRAEEILTLIFSAKESLYKCFYPRVQTYFGFHAARLLTFDATRGTFAIRLEQDVHAALRAHSCWSGVFSRAASLLMTALVVPRDARPSAMACA